MSETFEVDRGERDEAYCPYCNSCPSGAMTDEHVFPKSIGGDCRSVIRVCVRCNSKAGHTVDPLISKHSWLRMLAFYSGNLMKHQERHESIGVLKDGRRLTGRFYWVKGGKNEATVRFEPDKIQADGSKWLSESACGAKLPKDINIYCDQMLDSASFMTTPPEEAGLETAMVKILLGGSYWVRGKEALMLPGFDALRNSLSGTLDPRVTVTWLESVDAIKDGLPFEFRANEHTVWGECPDGETFVGGVCLFGRIVAEIKIEKFGSKLEGRCSGTPNNWLPRTAMD